MDLKLEVVVLPVTDIDQAKHFYLSLGWRLDADIAAGDDFRVVQFTAPGSPCSIIFGAGITTAGTAPVTGLHLAVTDIEAARTELMTAGVEVGEVFHDVGGVFTTPAPKAESRAHTRSARAMPRSLTSATPTATAGGYKRSRLGCRGE